MLQVGLSRVPVVARARGAESPAQRRQGGHSRAQRSAERGQVGGHVLLEDSDGRADARVQEDVDLTGKIENAVGLVGGGEGRKSVVRGKRVSVRGDRGGRRIINKKVTH